MRRIILLIGIIVVFCGCSGASVYRVAEGFVAPAQIGEYEQAPGTVPKSVGQSPSVVEWPLGVAPDPGTVPKPKTMGQSPSVPKWVLVEGSRFETEYDVRLANRTTNLEVAARTVDGFEIEPSGVFSFNELVGLATEEKGYKKAKIFYKGEEVDGLGGGICQLSSAIFNSAELGGLEIVERHPHSMRVWYVPEGRDAATAYGGMDLKFKNTLDVPIRISAQMADGVLVVLMEKKV